MLNTFDSQISCGVCFIFIYIIVFYHTFLGCLTLRRHVTIFASCNSLAHNFPRSSFRFLLIPVSLIHRKPLFCFFSFYHTNILRFTSISRKELQVVKSFDSKYRSRGFLEGNYFAYIVDSQISFLTGLENLYGMIAYCQDVKTCRRALIGRHFGERWNPTECHEMCDNCKRTGDQSDGKMCHNV